MRRSIRFFVTVLTLTPFTAVSAEDWKQFRGRDGLGSGVVTSPLTKFDASKDVAWKHELPGRGLSSPIVVGDNVFVTTCEGKTQEQLSLLAFDVKSGKQKWKQTIAATGPTAAHPDNNMAAPTPASDGHKVIALFGTNDVLCTDLSGKVLWQRSLFKENPGATDGRGLASSPIIVDRTFVALIENPTTSFATGIEIETGKSKWRIDRPKHATWSSPVTYMLPNMKEPRVVLHGGKLVSAHIPATGKEAWRLEQDFDSIPSSTIAGNLLLLPTAKGLAAYELAENDRAPKQVWVNGNLGPRTASLAVTGNRVYSSRGPILASARLSDGKEPHQLRVKGNFSSSPIVAGEYLYLFNDAGVCHIVKVDGKEAKLVGEAALNQRIQCTPAVANDAMYVRSDKMLFKIQGSSKDAATERFATSNEKQ